MSCTAHSPTRTSIQAETLFILFTAALPGASTVPITCQVLEDLNEYVLRIFHAVSLLTFTTGL